jgi:competence protein ComEA
MSNALRTLALALALVLPLSAAPLRSPHGPQRPVNLNTATVTELMQLPRVGQKTAERIVAFRWQHGGFQRPEELMNVKGISVSSPTPSSGRSSSPPLRRVPVPKK